MPGDMGYLGDAAPVVGVHDGQVLAADLLVRVFAPHDQVVRVSGPLEVVEHFEGSAATGPALLGCGSSRVTLAMTPEHY
jgi:hypothetical protein